MEKSQRRCPSVIYRSLFLSVPAKDARGGTSWLSFSCCLFSFSLSCGHVIFALDPSGHHALHARCNAVLSSEQWFHWFYCFKVFYFVFSDFSCNYCPVNVSFWWLLLGKVCWLHLLTLYPVQGSKALFALPLNSCCAYCKYDCRLFIHSMYFLWFTVSDNHGFYRFDLLTVLCAFFGLFFSHLRERLFSLLRKCCV